MVHDRSTGHTGTESSPGAEEAWGHRHKDHTETQMCPCFESLGSYTEYSQRTCHWETDDIKL